MGIFLGAFLIAIFGGLGVALFLFGRAAREGGADTKDPVAALNRIFDGRQDVSCTLNIAGMQYGQVVLGGKERGYRLVHESSGSGAKTLIFTKEPEGAPPAS